MPINLHEIKCADTHHSRMILGDNTCYADCVKVLINHGYLLFREKSDTKVFINDFYWMCNYHQLEWLKSLPFCIGQAKKHAVYKNRNYLFVKITSVHVAI